MGSFSFQSGGKNTTCLALRQAFESATDVRIAVAWSRISGLDLLWEEIVHHLKGGHTFTLVTGVDGGNTSIEALRALAALAEDFDAASCLVRHQEGSPLFHPKFYSFTTDDRCVIYSGSSNLTAAGLHSNEEFMVRTECEFGSQGLAQFDAIWRRVAATGSSLVRPLTVAACDELERLGYALPEVANRASDQSDSAKQKRKAPLFGSTQPGRAPFRGSLSFGKPTGSAAVKKAGGSSKVARAKGSAETIAQIDRGFAIEPNWSRITIELLRSRGSQSQLPKAVFHAIKRKLGHSDLAGNCEVHDKHSGAKRRISPAAGGNTYKLESGLSGDAPLVAKFEAVGKLVQVEFLEGSHGEGKRLIKYLRDGEKADPPMTVNVKPSAPNATSYRID